jgi:hypothetical protein
MGSVRRAERALSMDKNWVAIRAVAYALCAICFASTLSLIGIDTAWAATFTVGPDGQFEAIQTAIVAALIAPGDDEIRVQAGGYSEHLSITQSQDTLRLSGGWNSSFSSFNPSPLATIVNGGHTDSVLKVRINGSGLLLVNRLTLIQGRAALCGGGADLRLDEHAQVAMGDITVYDNEVVDDPQQVGVRSGGGLCIEMLNDSSLVLTGLDVESNNVSNAAQSAEGGGIRAYAAMNARLRIQDCRIAGNGASISGSSGLAYAGGIYLIAANAAIVNISDCDIVNNSVSGREGSAGGGALYLASEASGSLTVERTRWLQNSDQSTGAASEQLELGAAGTAILEFNNSLVAEAERGLLVLSLPQSAGLRIVNSTIANNQGTGLRFISPVPTVIQNTIVFGNGNDNVNCPTSACFFTANLIGVDPRFVGAHDYRLRANSPARDAGTNTPAGGLSSEDLDRSPRVVGRDVDIGAYEYQSLFSDGFE